MTPETKARSIEQENWHAMKEEEMLKILDTSISGISNQEATHRLNVYGENALPIKKPPTIWQILLRQVLNPLIFILLAAAVASIAIGEMTDAIFILIVIVLNSGLGAYQEYNAEQSASSLQKLLRIKARAVRDGEPMEIDARKLVPGDLVMLESGNKVPADMRLIEVNSLQADESFLTGESIAAIKKPGQLKEKIGVPERSNMAFAGATITAGRAKGVVTTTGIRTEVGKIAENVSTSLAAKPPLVHRMEKFTKQVSILVVIFGAILAFIMWSQGSAPTEIFFFVVALSVSAIPEGLPVALTVALSIATKRMSRRKVIVRKLPAVESLGSCTVIASDKTGTLTVNQQTIRMVVLPNGNTIEVSGEGYNGQGEITLSQKTESQEDDMEQLLKISKLSVLTNEAMLEKKDDEWVHYGDAMDVAFLALAYKAGTNPEEIRNENTLEAQIPYESERKFSAAFYEKDNNVMVAAKGAVETILGFCTNSINNNTTTPLDKDAIEKHADKLAAEGYRVLAVAGGEYENFEKQEVYEDEDIPDLIFYGLIAFIDPLRSEAKDAVDKCHQAGIKVLMITGDHPATATTIARQLDIAEPDEHAVTGAQLKDAGPPDSPAYEKLVASSHVFARVSPLQKLEIVDVLIRKGEFVAVTGDGVNDAPALKRANIGVAMGSGTDVAKEISSMIVTDDNFSSIVSGVEEGRFAYDNVRKVIYLLISTGAAEVMLFIAAILAGMPLPLLAVQLLWLNLVTNGIQDVALAFEGGEPGAMKRKPRKTNEKIFNPLMIQQSLVSGFTIGAVAFGFWIFLTEYQGMAVEQARNMVLLLMVLMQNVHVFNCRSETISAFKVPISRNKVLIFGVILAQGIHILSMQLPFMQNVLRVEPISFFEWAEVLILAIPLLLVMELFKWFKKRNSK